MAVAWSQEFYEMKKNVSKDESKTRHKIKERRKMKREKETV